MYCALYERPEACPGRGNGKRFVKSNPDSRPCCGNLELPWRLNRRGKGERQLGNLEKNSSRERDST